MVPTAWLAKVRLAGDRLAATAVPWPVRLTLCGLPVALSVMASEAARPLAAEGVKETLMVQLAPAATEPPQLLDCAKSPAFVPETAMPLTVNAALPELVRVTARAALVAPTAWLAKVRLVGDRLAAAVAPVPVRLTLCGLPVALSVRVRAAVRVPATAGIKVTLIVQLEPAATLDPQLLD